MKRMLFLLLAVGLCGGCARNYNIVLSNGDIVTSRGKPHFDKAKEGYSFTDASGNKDFISVMRVREIAPASHSGNSTSTYDLRDITH